MVKVSRYNVWYGTPFRTCISHPAWPTTWSSEAEARGLNFYHDHWSCYYRIIRK